MILLILSIISHFIFPIKNFKIFPYNLFGIILIIFGIIINIWTDQLFTKNKTTVKPHKNPSTLIINGPFKISRHPMYLGMFSILFGVAILFCSLVSLIFPIVFFILMEKIFIPIEEKNLQKVFGKKYFDYKEKVRKWI
jgi:protein-S-isoprenylcysteine O-methyltransferase Ste14